MQKDHEAKLLEMETTYQDYINELLDEINKLKEENAILRTRNVPSCSTVLEQVSPKQEALTSISECRDIPGTQELDEMGNACVQREGHEPPKGAIAEKENAEKNPASDVPSSELEVPTRDDSQPTPTPWCVFDACADGDRDRVKTIVAKDGFDIEDTNENGNTALTFACTAGHIEIARLLLEKGANLDTADENGWTALKLACTLGYIEIARLLVEKGANLHTVDKYTELNGQSCVISLRDGRSLYVNNDWWCAAACAGEHTNDDTARNFWVLQPDGVIALGDGRQLFVNDDGWCCVVSAGEYNPNPARNSWVVQPDGVLALGDGRPLYVNDDGWCCVVSAEEYTTENPRCNWRVTRKDPAALEALGLRYEDYTCDEDITHEQFNDAFPSSFFTLAGR